jgi:heat shock protein HslJ
MRRIAAFVTLAVVLFAGCTGMTATPTLDGSAWQLTGWSESGGDPSAFKITANFGEGQMAGKSGVNNYFGPYTAGPGDKFTVGNTGSTRMAGPPEAMQAEQTFFKLLEQVRTWRRSGGELTLADADGKALLIFRAAAPAGATP